MGIDDAITEGQNMQSFKKNSRTGVRGVSFHKPSGTYQARARIWGKPVCFGYHPTIEDAERALEEAGVFDDWPKGPYSEFEVDIAKRMMWTPRQARLQIATFQKAGIFLVTGDAPC